MTMVAIWPKGAPAVHVLDDGQVAALRLALIGLLEGMGQPGALGVDEHGEAMRTAYLARGRELLALLGEP
jgi:hypothetical protein